LAKSNAIVSKHRQHIQLESERKPKVIKKIHQNSLPVASQSTKDEKVISQYIEVLRKTHINISQTLLSERIQAKQDKKLGNRNYLKNKLSHKKSKTHEIRNKIRLMRRERVFPQPKSFTNYKNRNGLLKKNTIKLDDRKSIKIKTN
jgi:hypothetical protein